MNLGVTVDAYIDKGTCTHSETGEKKRWKLHFGKIEIKSFKIMLMGRHQLLRATTIHAHTDTHACTHTHTCTQTHTHTHAQGRLIKRERERERERE